MNDITPNYSPNDVHVASVLSLLPISAYTLAESDIDLRINGERSVGDKDLKEVRAGDIKANDVFSFLDSNGERVEYALLMLRSSEEGFDVALFKDVNSGKIIINYPGLNDMIDDFGLAAEDYFTLNTIDTDFVRSVNDEIYKIISQMDLPLDADHIQCISHSSGDAENLFGVADLLTRYNICTTNLLINPWDSPDALRVALAVGAKQYIDAGIYSPDEYEDAVKALYNEISMSSTTLYGRTDFQWGANALNYLLPDEELFDQTIRTEGTTTHSTCDFICVNSGDFKEVTNDKNTELVNEIIENACEDVKAHMDSKLGKGSLMQAMEDALKQGLRELTNPSNYVKPFRF